MNNGWLVPSGGGVTTLDYMFQVPVAPGTYLQYGWVVIYNPSGTPSDLIHFGNSRNSGGHTYDQMFFYSHDQGPAADHWVDGATLTAILDSHNLVQIHENASGIAYYTPSGSASPGWDVGGGTSAAFSFRFITAVPEPTTMLAGAGGLGSALLIIGRARRSGVVRIGK